MAGVRSRSPLLLLLMLLVIMPVPHHTAAAPGSRSRRHLLETSNVFDTDEPLPAAPTWLPLCLFRYQNRGAAYIAALHTLDRVISDIVEHPELRKYRVLHAKGNSYFFKHVLWVQYGLSLVQALGFHVSTNTGPSAEGSAPWDRSRARGRSFAPPSPSRRAGKRCAPTTGGWL
jgi:hypothetical protein